MSTVEWVASKMEVSLESCITYGDIIQQEEVESIQEQVYAA